MQREVHGYDMIDFFSLEAEKSSLESAFSRQTPSIFAGEQVSSIAKLSQLRAVHCDRSPRGGIIRFMQI